MYFEVEDDDGGLFNPDLYHVVHRELYALNSNQSRLSSYGLRNVPTHTEDGIPIRKLYVSNLPPKTTRTELFGVFAQYGFIKSCWLRMDDKGPNRTPTYAFVTFSNAADAHKALRAPIHEKTLRGRNLRISPADSWHQPAEDVDGQVRWQGNRKEDDTTPWNSIQQNDSTAESSGVLVAASNETSNDVIEAVEDVDYIQSYSMLDILNRDCLSHILTYVPIRDLIRSERVSKRWQAMIQEYLQTVRMFKTSWWQHVPVTLTTAVLRRVLARLGGALLRLHIDHHWSALNDRTAHTVGKFCPQLEELTVVCMHTKNWNPLIYGCKHLKSLSFISCNKLTDTSLVHLVKSDSSIESLVVANNTHVTGLFLTGSQPSKLSSLAFHNCYSLQGTVLSAALDTLPSLTTLKLDVGPVTMWKIIPLILSKLPKLEELSLSGYASHEMRMEPPPSEALCKSLSGLTELKILNLSRNIFISNSILKTVAQSCPKLESLDISSCNSRRLHTYSHITRNRLDVVNDAGVDDEGVKAIFSLGALSRLDLSYLALLSDDGMATVALLPRLTALTSRGNPALSAAPFAAALAACPLLKEIDVCGCDAVSEELVCAAVTALRLRPRPLVLHLAATAAADRQQEMESHPLLSVDMCEDRSDPHLRPDYVDQLYGSSNDAIEDFFDRVNYGQYLMEDEDMFIDEDDLDDYGDMVQMNNIVFI